MNLTKAFFASRRRVQTKVVFSEFDLTVNKSSQTIKKTNLNYARHFFPPFHLKFISFS